MARLVIEVKDSVLASIKKSAAKAGMTIKQFVLKALGIE